MAKAARAIIIEDGKILVMYRNKNGSEYYTLVGGQVADSETIQQALTREVKEETGLDVTTGRPVFIEEHLAPYNQQFIYLCTIAPHGNAEVQEASEEGQMNKLGTNMHTPLWVSVASFASLPFRTPDLQTAIVIGLRKGFPEQPVTLTDPSYANHTKSKYERLRGLPGKLLH